MSRKIDLENQISNYYNAENTNVASDKVLDVLEELWDMLNSKPTDAWEIIYLAQLKLPTTEGLAKLAAAHFEELVRSPNFPNILKDMNVNEVSAAEKLSNFVWFGNSLEKNNILSQITERKLVLHIS